MNVKKLLTLLLTVFSMTLLFGTTAFAEEQEDRFPTYEKVGVISDSDLCDQELADLFKGTLVKSELSPILDGGAYAPSEVPDIVFVLFTNDNFKNGEFPDRIALQEILSRIAEGAGEAHIGVIALTEAKSAKTLSGFYKSVNDFLKMDRIGHYAGNYSYYYKDADSEERQALAARIAGPLKAYGIYYRESVTEYNDIPFYVFESGDDNADGRTPETAVKSAKGLLAAVKNYCNQDFRSFHDNDHISIYMQGRIMNSNSQAWLLMNNKYNTLPRTKEGKNIPVLLTTYQFNGSNRASLVFDYKAQNDSNARSEDSLDMVCKDINISSIANQPSQNSEEKFNINKVWITDATLTFDNCTFNTETGDGWILYACDNCWSTNFGDPENPRECTARLVFKNGEYGLATGVSQVVCMGTYYLWRDAKEGQNLYDATFMNCEVVADYRSVIETVYCTTSTLPVKSLTVSAKNGGTIKKLQTVGAASEANDLNIKLDGGKIGCAIYGIKSKLTFEQNINFDIRDSILYLDSTESETDSNLLGCEGAIFHGDLNFNMEDSLLVTACGLNTPSSFYFGGIGMQECSGNAAYTLRNSTFVGIPNEMMTNDSCDLVFGSNGGTMTNKVFFNIESGLFDWSLFPEHDYIFLSAFSDCTAPYGEITLGEEGKANDRGPIFLSGNVILGGAPNYLGDLTTTIYNGVFEKDLYLSPGVYADIVSAASGSIHTDISGGLFLGNTVLVAGDIEGDFITNITGGEFNNVVKTENGAVVEGANEFTESGAKISKINGLPKNLILYLIIGGVVIIGVIVLLLIMKKKKGVSGKEAPEKEEAKTE